MALKVNRPDPENRNFAHPDPLAWTQLHRRKILAGALHDPDRRRIEPPATSGDQNPLQNLVGPCGMADGVCCEIGGYYGRLY